MKTHEQIMGESSKARETAKRESATWAEGTSATAAELEGEYEDYVVIELESGNDDYLCFERWAEEIRGIPNE